MFSSGITEMARRWARRIAPFPREVDAAGLGQDDYVAIFLETAWMAMGTLKRKHPEAREIDLLRYSKAAMKNQAFDALARRIRQYRHARECALHESEWSLHGLLHQEQALDPMCRLEAREQLCQLEERLPGWAFSVQRAMETRRGKTVYELRKKERESRNGTRSC